MSLKQVTWFTIAYVVLVALAIWFNLAILCQGDPKYSGGCGGFAVYIPLWELFLLPLPITAVLVERWRRTRPPSTVRLIAYLVAVLAVAEIGFLLIEKFPMLLAIEALAIGLAVMLRWRTTRGAGSAEPAA